MRLQIPQWWTSAVETEGLRLAVVGLVWTGWSKVGVSYTCCQLHVFLSFGVRFSSQPADGLTDTRSCGAHRGCDGKCVRDQRGCREAGGGQKTPTPNGLEYDK